MSECKYCLNKNEYWAIRHQGGCNSKANHDYSIYRNRQIAELKIKNSCDFECCLVKVQITEIGKREYFEKKKGEG